MCLCVESSDFTSGLSREDCKKLKAKRRTLKNRGYAASCRYKRDEQERNLQDTKNKLKNDIDALKRNSEDLERSTQNLKESNLYRLKWALRANIDIPDHIKMSYPPEVQAQALLLPEHGKPLNGSVQLELCIIFYLVQALSLTILVSSNQLQPPLWTCQPGVRQPWSWTWTTT